MYDPNPAVRVEVGTTNVILVAVKPSDGVQVVDIVKHTCWGLVRSFSFYRFIQMEPVIPKDQL